MMVKRNAGTWLAATALGALLPLGTAFAADLPVKARPIIAANFDWSGIYIGAHAGYGGGAKDWQQGGGLPEADFIARGALAGGQAGINKQIGSLVIGAELSGSWADIGGSSHTQVGSAAAAFLVQLDHASKIDSIATFAGRAGLAADRWFVFAKAGLSAVHEKHSSSFIQVVPQPGASAFVDGSEVRYAPMLGFGTEYALSGNWSVFGEYNFHYLGDRSVSFRGTTTFNGVTVPFVANMGIDQAIHVAKAGVNYRWGGVQIDPSYAPVPAAPGNNWSGGYVGVQGGYAWGHKSWPDLGLVQTADYRTEGWLAGGSIGANAQAGSFVFGVEGEIMATGINSTFALTNAIPGAGVATLALNTKVDWLALATARAGFVVGSNLMLYAKGGVAIAEEKHSLDINAGPGQALNVSATGIHTGGVIGAGAEYAIARNWSIKAEYDYVKMMPQKLIGSGTASGFIGPGTVDFLFPLGKAQQDLHLVKFGVNYHFNALPVVVAKY